MEWSNSRSGSSTLIPTNSERTAGRSGPQTTAKPKRRGTFPVKGKGPPARPQVPATPWTNTWFGACARRPRLRAPARAPDFVGFTDGPRAHSLGARSRPVWPHPGASPPCGRRARAGTARLAACSWSTIRCAPLYDARWNRGPDTDVIPAARSGEPRCAERRPHLEPLACRPAGDGGCVADLRATVHPVHVPIPLCERASDGLTALTLVYPHWTSPRRSSRTPSTPPRFRKRHSFFSRRVGQCGRGIRLLANQAETGASAGWTSSS